MRDSGFFFLVFFFSVSFSTHACFSRFVTGTPAWFPSLPFVSTRREKKKEKKGKVTKMTNAKPNYIGPMTVLFLIVCPGGRE